MGGTVYPPGQMSVGMNYPYPIPPPFSYGSPPANQNPFNNPMVSPYHHPGSSQAPAPYHYAGLVQAPTGYLPPPVGTHYPSPSQTPAPQYQLSQGQPPMPSQYPPGPAPSNTPLERRPTAGPSTSAQGNSPGELQPGQPQSAHNSMVSCSFLSSFVVANTGHLEWTVPTNVGVAYSSI